MKNTNTIIVGLLIYLCFINTVGLIMPKSKATAPDNLLAIPTESDLPKITQVETRADKLLMFNESKRLVDWGKAIRDPLSQESKERDRQILVFREVFQVPPAIYKMTIEEDK